MTHDPVTLTAALLLGTVAVARCTRLVTSDTWPPILWLRLRWLTWTANGGTARQGWEELFTCAFCFAPYASAGDAALAGFSGLAPWWWWLNVIPASAYLAAAFVARDEPPAEE